MARISKKSLLNGASGKVGHLVFRTVRGNTYVSPKPRKSRDRPNDQQLEVRFKFARAAKYASAANRDLAVKSEYSKGAGPGLSAYNVALRDACHPPVVHHINTSDYEGNVGDPIRVEASDDFKVSKVVVTIFSPEGALVEMGEAKQHYPEALYWTYEATAKNVTITNCEIRAVAHDMPGNEGVKVVGV